MKIKLSLLFLIPFFASFGEEVNELIVNIENSPHVKEMITFACINSSRIEKIIYNCPKCKKEMIYILSPYDDTSKNRIDLYSNIVYLDSYKRRIEKLNLLSKKYGIKFALDEKEFCPEFSTKGSPREFHLKVDNKGKIIITKLTSPIDITKLIFFFRKEVIWQNFVPEKRSLKEELPFIKNVLGLNSEKFERKEEPILSPLQKQHISAYDLLYEIEKLSS